MKTYAVKYMTGDMAEPAELTILAVDVYDASRLSYRHIRDAGVDPRDVTWLEVTLGSQPQLDPHRVGGMAA